MGVEGEVKKGEGKVSGWEDRDLVMRDLGENEDWGEMMFDEMELEVVVLGVWLWVEDGRKWGRLGGEGV